MTNQTTIEFYENKINRIMASYSGNVRFFSFGGFDHATQYRLGGMTTIKEH